MTSRPLTSPLLASPIPPSPRLTCRSKSNHPLRAIVLGTILAVTFLAPSAGMAYVRNVYDGAWSVLIVTKSGSCDPTYRYGVQISDGMVIYDGIGPVTMQGRVTPTGAVRVIVTSGSQWADGTGKLSRNQGGGVWKGQGMSSACAGTWQAERRE